MAIEVKCVKHPKYTAARPPRASCKFCLMIYYLVEHARLHARELAGK